VHFEIVSYNRGLTVHRPGPRRGPSVSSLYTGLGHAVLYVRMRTGEIHDLSWNSSGLQYDSYPSERAPPVEFGEMKAVRFCPELASAGFVIRGHSLSEANGAVHISELWRAAVNHDATVDHKMGNYKIGTNCLAFCLKLEDFLLSRNSAVVVPASAVAAPASVVAAPASAVAAPTSAVVAPASAVAAPASVVAPAASAVTVPAVAAPASVVAPTPVVVGFSATEAQLDLHRGARRAQVDLLRPFTGCCSRVALYKPHRISIYVDVDGFLMRIRDFCTNHRCADSNATSLPWYNTRSRTQKRTRNQVLRDQKAACLRTLPDTRSRTQKRALNQVLREQKAACLRTLPVHYERPVTRGRSQKLHLTAHLRSNCVTARRLRSNYAHLLSHLTARRLRSTQFQ
jgi:hypothetical protein